MRDRETTGRGFRGWEMMESAPSCPLKPSVLSLRSAALRKWLLFPPPECPWAHWYCQALTRPAKGPAPCQAPAGFPSPRQGHREGTKAQSLPSQTPTPACPWHRRTMALRNSQQEWQPPLCQHREPHFSGPRRVGMWGPLMSKHWTEAASHSRQLSHLWWQSLASLCHRPS